MTPYQAQAAILKTNLKPTLAEKKSINPFFFCRWLSGNRHTVPISAVLNRYYNMPIEVQYQFAEDYSELVGLPGKVKFIGITKEKKNAQYQKVIDNISRYYKVNNEIAEDYFKIMDDNTRDKMMEMYNEGKM